MAGTLRDKRYVCISYDFETLKYSILEIDREMAIAIVNSDFYHNVHESDEWDDYSPCDEHFDTRYAIGTHAADYHELKDWSSMDAHSTYVRYFFHF